MYLLSIFFSNVILFQTYEVPDIVISANPSYPPYFLLFLQELLKNEVFLNINCYLHSSISKMPKNCEAFLRKLTKSQENGIPSVLIRLIWKESKYFVKL